VQVRVVFQIPTRAILQIFRRSQSLLAACVLEHLAYVEWFNPIPAMPDGNHGMYRVSRSFSGERRQASIIPVDSIVSSVHLFPKVPNSPQGEDWNSFTVLEHCRTFYINPFSDRDAFLQFS
jgi:hypothetical protein